MKELQAIGMYGKPAPAARKSRKDDEPFYHAWHHEVPLKLTRAYRLAIIAMFCFVGLGTYWAVSAPIDGAFMADGRLVAQGKNRIVEHLEGGIVNEVLVKEGEQVKAGDLLARIDVTSAEAKLATAQMQRDVARVKLARYLAEQRGDDEIVLPPDLERRIAEEPELADTASSQREEFEAKTAEMTSLKTILNQRIDNNQQLLDNLKEMLTERRERVEATQEEVRVSSDLLDKGLTTRDRNFALNRQLASDQDNVRQTLIQMDDKRSTINETQEQLNRALSQRANEVAQQITDLRSNIFELSSNIRYFSDVTKRSEVRAPVSGTIVNVAVNTQDQVIKPGDPIFEILPEGVPMSIEAMVDPHYIDSVRQGQHVSIRFPSRERSKAIQILDGEVSYISPDSEQDEKTGRYFYKVRASVDPESLKEYGKVMPGNVGQVYFELENKTFLEYLIEPYQDMRDKAFVG
ncbi:HlyD family type I secretion periplasmic adaptor subunit [Afifella marina]|uniref:Membrane fusion protein (MFP) family protein n=1 Tax=Afifella marina DSM 2698 TaxID=1120955 RepID=A0A1G5NB84_AFIMA|nr:HlyD family type I secretion periplasmic adaptor subunit [Afifella marina]MBK1623199.1 HlyD family type I secretion periplasmic adaptor subunit [Afifella marina DSM 2698]MBK1626193.1 HlyD family type I secretion periplasmic adaptor subunit [Afifella marina]MBK5917071.1 hypothetical protein [Afifella marina]RAI22063.1 hypothetical protein CH311_04955 [Afifella marina DSM 2698]SCZ34632.1 HlyD family secretion protein [Afifella marina DSM 2698]